MGMFDYVECEYPLPDRPEWAQTFQTKSLTNVGENYRIASDGTLWTFDGRSGAPQTFTPHTGSVEFYTMRQNFVGYWVEYHALFDHGKLIGVVQRALDVPVDMEPRI